MKTEHRNTQGCFTLWLIGAPMDRYRPLLVSDWQGRCGQGNRALVGWVVVGWLVGCWLIGWLVGLLVVGWLVDWLICFNL